MLEIIVEEGVYGSMYPVEISSDAPIASLVPALVKELHLPQVDASGNQLEYHLRLRDSQQELPPDLSLGAAGVKPGTCLSLQLAVASAGAVRPQRGRPQPSALHSDVTLVDLAATGPALEEAVNPSGTVASHGARQPRRVFLTLLGGAALGAAGLGASYAAYHYLLKGNLSLPGGQPAMKPTTTATQMQMHPTATALPTTAQAELVFARHRQTVRALTWSPDGTMLASGSLDAQLMIWNTQGQVQHMLTAPAAVRTLAWSSDGTQLAAGAGNVVLFINPQTGALLTQPMQRHAATVTSVAWSSQGPLRLVSASLDKRAIVWSGTNWLPLLVFTRHTSAIEAASWAADGLSIATASTGGVVRVWRATDGQEVHGYYQDGQVVLRTLDFSAQGMPLAVGGDDALVRLWSNSLTCQRQQATGFGPRCLDVPQHLRAHTQAVRTLAWSPDGRLLASAGNDGLLAVWYPARSQTPLLTVHLGTPVLSLHWSPDGKRIATAAGNRVTLWLLK
jgi:WD40 repeat protein